MKSNRKKSKPPCSPNSKYYFSFLVILLSLLSIALYGMAVNYEIAARFVPTIAGLILTLFFFYIFLERMEKEKLKEAIRSIFTDLVWFCVVEDAPTDEKSKEAWKPLGKGHLEELASEVKLDQGKVNQLWVGQDLRESWSLLFDDERSVLVEAKNRYGDLSRHTRFSFIHFDRFLKELSRRLVEKGEKKEDYERVIRDSIQKIMKEIVELRESGIDIGF